MQRILSPKMRGALRHLLSSFGPLLAANGLVTDATWQSVVGVIMTALAFYDSWKAPEKQP